ncbi:MAG TPA: hypothetical protein VKD91_20390 [Pyrinomonadaceae bacterium]|nr:hypothetical protein [Pyrinomonadaceae bacterium]
MKVLSIAVIVLADYESIQIDLNGVRPNYFLTGRDGKIAVAAPAGAKFDLGAELAGLFARK